jgi:hypothetical protein
MSRKLMISRSAPKNLLMSFVAPYSGNNPGIKRGASVAGNARRHDARAEGSNIGAREFAAIQHRFQNLRRFLRSGPHLFLGPQHQAGT